MTKTEWKKAERAIQTRGRYIGSNGLQIVKIDGAYGAEYSIREAGVGTISVEYDILRVKDIVVD